MPNPQRAEKDWPPVVVASIFQTGLNLMRDLGRHGVRAIGVDHDPRHEGFRSIYGESHLCPHPDRAPGAWLEYMQSLSRRLGAKPVLIPAADEFVAAMGRHAEALSGFYIFPEATAGLQAALATKERQYALAREYGLPCPRSAYIENAEGLRAFIAGAQFPCLLKPRHQREWESLPEGNPLRGRKLVPAETADELLRHYHFALPYRPEALAQEIIAGPDSAKYCYLSAYSRSGERLGYCVVQEFRANPVFWGSASIVEPVVDEEIASVCDRFLSAIGYAGVCEIEVKRDSRNGKVLLVEVNPRVSGTGDCAIYAGVEVGWLHYLDLVGVRVEPVPASRFHFRHVTLRREVPSAVKYLEEGLATWGELLASYRMPLEFYDFDSRDLRVTAETLLKECARPLGGAVLRWMGLQRRSKAQALNAERF
jgi:D-aspartate ligase